MSAKGEIEFQWTPATIAQSIAIFCVAGFAEIFGGYVCPLKLFVSSVLST
jgi:hypothetical protein